MLRCDASLAGLQGPWGCLAAVAYAPDMDGDPAGFLTNRRRTGPACSLLDCDSLSALVCRGLGDALQQWHARLAMAGESAKPQPQDTQAEAPSAADEAQAPNGAEKPLGLGEYEFLSEKEGRQQGDAQTLAPASEEQARHQMESLQAQQGPDEEIPDADSGEHADFCYYFVIPRLLGVLGELRCSHICTLHGLKKCLEPV